MKEPRRGHLDYMLVAARALEVVLKISLSDRHASPDVRFWDEKVCAEVECGESYRRYTRGTVASSAFRMQQYYLTLVSALNEWRRSHTCHVREASSWQLAVGRRLTAGKAKNRFRGRSHHHRVRAQKREKDRHSYSGPTLNNACPRTTTILPYNSTAFE